jgi:hypothetical protein
VEAEAEQDGVLAVSSETERIRRIWERTAPNYDKKIAFWERVLFKDGRAWVCFRASGATLEIAMGPDAICRCIPRTCD